MANINDIQNGESGLSARNKINAAIAEANAVDSKQDAAALGTAAFNDTGDFVGAGAVGSQNVTTATGTQTVVQALDQRGPVFDSVADMKAATGLTVGIKCRTLGYYAPGDGGGNDYEIVAAGTGSNYGFLFEQLTASGYEAKLLSGGIMEDKTAYIPSDYGTLQAAIDDLSKLRVAQGATIDLMIESGHQPVSGVLVENGHYAHFCIGAVDAEVILAAGFPATDIIKGINAHMPTLNCLINANSLGVNGYFADEGSSGFVTAGSGIKYCNRQACYANSGSNISADDTVWTNSSQGAPFYSGILAWASTISAAGADVSNSLYYGAQAAASGTLHFRNGIANGAARHGVRATNGATVNARSATANDCGATGFRAFDSSTVHATGSEATGSVRDYRAQNNSKIAMGASTAGSVAALNSSEISMSDDVVSGNILAENNSTIAGSGVTASSSGRVLNCLRGSEMFFLNSDFTSDATGRAINITEGSKVVLESCDTTTTAGDYIAAVISSELTITGGAHSYPDQAINILDGSFVRLHGSGIPEGDCPGMLNLELRYRGIMWGAS